MRQVFVTGAAGCVGHYVLEHLLARQDCHPVVLLRDLSRLRSDLRARVTCIEGDLARPEPWLERLEGVDEAILVATSWGGPLARQVNVDTTHAIMRSMPRARRIVYFSTASMLEPDGSFDQAAALLGTDYIRTKHEAITTLEDPRVVPVFPTVVLGGDDRHPRSAATAGLPGLRPWRALLARLAFDGVFHVIHASDLARFAVWLLDHEAPPGRLVVGLPALTVREVAQALAIRLGARPAGPWDWTPLVERLPRLIPWKFTSWDLHCLARRQFRYPVVDLAGVTGRLDYPDLTAILASDPRLSDQQVPSERK
ncbi:MAG: NAD(P)-dependent oxidoreductase [Candidatus Sericytochromatia bacterium]|nr:NAD(P)-dependent oxidoreductase [Candidatus Sericytochromatia bacterium]